MANGTARTIDVLFARVPLAIWLLMMISTVLAPQANAQAPAGTVRIVPAISSIPATDAEFTAFVVVEDLEHHGLISAEGSDPETGAPSIGLAAFEFTFHYDETVIEVAAAEVGPDVGISGRSFQCLPPNRDEPGMFRFGCISTGSTSDGRQGTFTLAEVRFDIVGPGSSPLLLEAQIAGPLGDDVVLEVKGGVVRVTGALPEATRAAATAAPPTAVPEGETATPDGLPTQTSTPVRQPTAGAPAADATTAFAPTAERRDSADGSDSEAQNDASSSMDSNTSGSALLWTMIGLGSLVAAIIIGLGALAWRRRGNKGNHRAL